MPESVRAKFVVQSVKETKSGTEEVEMRPVMGGSEENEKFWEASPYGSLELGIDNEEAHGIFEPGDEFYVDFTPAE